MTDKQTTAITYPSLAEVGLITDKHWLLVGISYSLYLYLRNYAAARGVILLYDGQRYV